jgi:hypothetical protein
MIKIFLKRANVKVGMVSIGICYHRRQAFKENFARRLTRSDLIDRLVSREKYLSNSYRINFWFVVYLILGTEQIELDDLS